MSSLNVQFNFSDLHLNELALFYSLLLAVVVVVSLLSMSDEH